MFYSGRILHNLRLPIMLGKSPSLPNIQPNSSCSFKKIFFLQNPSVFSGKTNFLQLRYSSTSSSPPPSVPTMMEVMDASRFNFYAEPAGRAIGNFCETDFMLSLTEKMIDFHDYVGLPWWSVIMLSTVVMRTFVILPFAIHQHYVIARNEVLDKEFTEVIDKEIVEKVNKLAEQNNWNQRRLSLEYANEKDRRRSELVKKYNCHPFKHILLMCIQMPVWFSMSSVIRNLTYMQPVQDVTAQIVYMELKANNFLWIHDLTIPDATGFLPLIYAIINYSNVRVTAFSRKAKFSYWRRYLTVFMGLLSLTISCLAITLPTSLVLYWCTSSMYGLIQNLVLLSPRVRTFLRIPTPETMRNKPYTKLYRKFVNMFKFFRY